MCRLGYRIKKCISLGMISMVCLFTGCKDDEDVQNTEVMSEAVNQAQTIESQKDDVTEDGIKNDAVIMVVGEEEITYSEVMVYVMMLKQQYEPVFTKDIWGFSVSDKQTFEDMAKDEIINQIARLKIMGFEAGSLDVELNADERLEIEDSAVEFLQNVSMDDQNKYGITPEIVEIIYRDNVLAQKVFDVTTAEVDCNVSDEDATMMKFKQLKISYDPKKETNIDNSDDKDNTDDSKDDLKNNTQNNSANKQNEDKSTLPDKEKATTRIETIHNALVNKGKDMDYYINKYSDAKDKEITVVKGLKGQLDDDIKEEVIKLEKGKYSEIIETEDAYYIFYCINDNDTSEVESNKEKIIAMRQDKTFSEAYSNWLSKYDTFIVTELWNMIHFKEE